MYVAASPKHKKTDADDLKKKKKKKTKKEDKEEDKVRTKAQERKKKVGTLVPRPHVRVLEKDPLLETR